MGRHRSDSLRAIHFNMHNSRLGTVLPTEFTLLERLIAVMTDEEYRREKPYMKTLWRFLAVFGMALLIGAGCALGWDLWHSVIGGVIATPYPA